MAESESVRPITVVELHERLSVAESVLRTQGARLAQFEDVVQVYGPPKHRTLPIPELSREQRATLILIGVLMFLAVLPVIVSKGRSHYVSPI